MKIRRLAATTAAAAVLAPLFVLATGTQASAALPSISKYEQCRAAYYVNYRLVTKAYADSQWYACMS